MKIGTESDPFYGSISPVSIGEMHLQIRVKLCLGESVHGWVWDTDNEVMVDCDM